MALAFRGSNFANGYYNYGTLGSQASAISFNPEDPNMVAIGTMQNGLLISGDRGKTWTKVPESERVTLISSLHWRKADDLIVSTYGRGLYRVTFSRAAPEGDVWGLCKVVDCVQIFAEPPPGEQPSPEGEGLLAFGGRIEGARFENGMLQEIFIRPSTSIVFASDSGRVPDIKVTETTEPVGFVGLKRVPIGPKEAPVVGFTLRNSGKKSQLIGFVFAPEPLLMTAAEVKAEERPVGREESSNAGKPYLELLTGSSTSASRAIEVAGRNLEAGSTIEIAIDGRTVDKVVVAKGGRFSTTVETPREFGLHHISMINSRSRAVLAGASVTVMFEDERRAGEAGVRPQKTP